MAAPGLSALAITNNKVAGFTSVLINSGASFTTNKDTLLQIRDGKFSQEPYSIKKSIGSERVHAFLAKAEWKYLLCNYTNIVLLPTFTLDGCVAINLLSSNAVNFGNATVGGNGVVKWKVVLEGDSDKDAHIEMMVQRAGQYTGQLAADFDNDVLYAAANNLAGSAILTGTTMPTSGIRTFEIGDTTYDTVGPISDTKFTAELMCDLDSQLRYVPRNVHIEYSIKVQDFTSTSLRVLDTLNDQGSVDCRFTFIGDSIFTGSDILGAIPHVVNEGDSDKDAYITFTGSGDVSLDNFAALFTLRT